MKSSNHEISKVLLLASISALVGACGGAPQLRTQPERFAYLDPIISENLPRIAQCPTPKLTFETFQQVGTAVYDYHRLEGCGHRTAFITAVTRQDMDGTWMVTHEYGVAPAADELRAEAKGQLMKTAGKHDISCASVVTSASGT